MAVFEQHIWKVLQGNGPVYLPSQFSISVIDAVEKFVQFFSKRQTVQDLKFMTSDHILTLDHMYRDKYMKLKSYDKNIYIYT
jgi:hypothetical protein